MFTFLLVTKNHKKYISWSKHFEKPYNGCENIEWVDWNGELPPLNEIEGFELMEDENGNLIEDFTKPKKCYIDVKNKTLHKVFGDNKPFFKVEKVVA